MRTSTPDIDARATAARVEERRLTVDLADGRSITVPVHWFPRLEHATPKQLADWRLIGGGLGIHWPSIDEDLSVAGMLRVGPGRPLAQVPEEVIASATAAKYAVPEVVRPQYERSAMALRAAALSRIEREVGHVEQVPGTRAIFVARHAKLNLRTATEKRTGAYWFDVTPAYYEYGFVDFFTYVCGSPDHAFVFSRDEMQELAAQANRGGAKHVPNFTLHVSSREFEPAGSGGRRISIESQWNAFDRIRTFEPAA